MKMRFTVSVWEEDDWFVAQCLEIDVASQGRTEEATLANLQKALELRYEPPTPTVIPNMTSIEVEIGAP